MINYKNFTDADITIMFDGKPIGNMQSISCDAMVSKEKEIKNGDDLSLFSITRGASVTLSNVQISPGLKGKLLPMGKTSLTVIATRYNFPRGNKFPKRKRIRNKWMKKYARKIELDNCVIV